MRAFSCSKICCTTISSLCRCLNVTSALRTINKRSCLVCLPVTSKFKGFFQFFSVHLWDIVQYLRPNHYLIFFLWWLICANDNVIHPVLLLTVHKLKPQQRYANVTSLVNIFLFLFYTTVFLAYDKYKKTWE